MKYLFLFLSAVLFADSLSVVVTCSNGKNVPNLPVHVFDSNWVEVPNILPTDSNGTFVINDSELYVTPFYIYFKDTRGSRCGNYLVRVDESGLGSVLLNYYPTSLPCSCSHYVR